MLRQILGPLNLLNDRREPQLEIYLKLAVEVSHMPFAAISFFSDDTQWFKACLGFDYTQVPREHSPCHATLSQTNSHILDGTKAIFDFKDFVFFQDNTNIQFYFGLPIKFKDGIAVGTLSLYSDKQTTLTDTQKSLLTQLGALIENDFLEICWYRKYLHDLSQIEQYYVNKELKPELFEKCLHSLIDLSSSEFGIMGKIKKDENGEYIIHTYTVVNQDTNLTCQVNEDDLRSLSPLILRLAKTGERLHHLSNEIDTKMLNLGATLPSIHSFLSIPIFGADGLMALIFIANRHDEYGNQLISQLKPFIGILTTVIESNYRSKTIKKITKYDALTGIYNRQYFEANFLDIINAHVNNDLKLALLVVDLENFKRFNDTYGHHFGDELLSQFADRSHQLIKNRDTFARIGADEFYILLHDLDDYDIPCHIAKRLIKANQEPYTIFGVPITCKINIGIVCIPLSGKTPNELMKRADFAVMEAKKESKGWRFYSDDLEAKFYQQNDLEEAVKEAIDNNEFVFVYQPQMNIDTMQITGFEALIRWQHPLKGQVAPDVFIPIIEQRGFSEKLNYYVITHVLKDFSKIIMDNARPMKLAINLSPNVEDLVEHLNHLLSHSKTVPRNSNVRLEFELTESSFSNHKSTQDEEFETTTKRLRSANISLAIDDFGTKYSSILRLMAHDFKTIKIDRSFIAQLSEKDNKKALAIVKSIVSLSKDVGFELVAEGVENQTQLSILRDLGCHTIQGYYFYKPMSIKKILNIL